LFIAGSSVLFIVSFQLIRNHFCPSNRHTIQQFFFIVTNCNPVCLTARPPLLTSNVVLFYRTDAQKEHVKVYLIENELDENAIRKAIAKLADWRINQPDAKLLLQFNEPLTKGFAQKLIDAGVLPLLTTTASFVAPLVDRKQLVRETGMVRSNCGLSQSIRLNPS
jgi:hypothetical protein